MLINPKKRQTKAITAKRPAPIPMTQVGLDKAREDYQQLQLKREEVLLRLQAAREQGDLSENGAYTAAKFELGATDRQLRQLGYLLKYGVVTSSLHSGKVGFGNTVTLEKEGKTLTFMLVSGFESNPAAGKLSEQSPFGRAVINRQVGETVVVKAPAGESIWKIVKVV